uniref:UspA domain-containing protein n=1 Tax=Kalanchoe fedtschenkoi TaxID=63787 RepID=A0A7N0R9W6_KALFE
MDCLGLGVKKKKIVVAVDESEESMYALCWSIRNLVQLNPNSTLVLLYVKPMPPLHSPLDAAAYMFVDDVVAALGRYGSELVRLVMSRAEAVCMKFGTNMNTNIIRIFIFIFTLRANIRMNTNIFIIINGKPRIHRDQSTYKTQNGAGLLPKRSVCS